VYERAGSVTQREFFFTVNAADSFEQRYPSLGLTTDFVGRGLLLQLCLPIGDYR